MIEEYWIESYDEKNRRHHSVYYATKAEAEQVAKNLEEQGHHDIEIHIFRY